MAIKKIIILSTLFVQILSAPSGCLQSCRTYGSYNTHETSSGFNEQTANLEDLSGASNIGLGSNTDFSYSKPGNWTEHNQYATDGGRGKVYEEHGQYVKGPKRVRFFKKNYTSSYTSGNMGDLASANRENFNTFNNRDSTQSSVIDHSLRSSDQLNGLENVDRRSAYSALYGQQTQQSSRRVDSQSEKLEDFGESGNNEQVVQHGVSGFNSQTAQNLEGSSRLKSGNWSNVNAYKTDGGRGKVFEEQGQYVTGPKRVNYYMKNYTSSYSTGDIPTLNTGSVRMQDFEKEMKQLHKQFDNFGREIHQTGSSYVTTSNSGLSNAADLTQGTIDSGYVNGNLQKTETGYQHETNSRRTSATNIADYSAGQGTTANFDTAGINGQSQQISQNTYTQSAFVPESTVVNQYGYRYKPSTNTYGTQNYQNSYGSEDHLISQASNRSPSPIETQTVTHGQASQSHYEQLSNTEQSGYTQSHAANGNIEQGLYNQNVGDMVTGTRPGRVRHHEQYWSSSVHRQGGLGPDADITSLQASDNQQIQQMNQRQSEQIDNFNQQSSYDMLHGRNTYVGQTDENNYNHAFRTRPGKLVTSTLDVSQRTPGADCTEGSEGVIQYGSRYHRKYKRDAKYHEANDMMQLHQQTGRINDFAQQNDHLQQHEDLTQQNQDETQQTQGFDDFTQQSQSHLQQNEDLTQQTSGNLEFGQDTQQTWNPDKANINNQRSSDLTQQTEDLTQQTGGFDDFTQQASGKLEFGPNVQQSWNSGNVNINNQQGGALTQQTEDLTQQTEGGFDHFTQQTSGNLEFGQNTQQHSNSGKANIDNQQSGDLTQQTEDLTQQTGGFDGFTQQTSGKLEFGKQTQKPWKFDATNVDDQRTGDLTQQNEDLTQQTGGFGDFTQQTSGNLEFGQNTQQPWNSGSDNVNDQRSSDLTQQTEDLTQQTGGFDDFTQHTSGKLEHQQAQSQWNYGNLETDSQSTQDLTQQSTIGRLENEQNWNPKRLSARQTGDLTRQIDDGIEEPVGHLEFSQQNQYPTQLEIEQLSQQRNEDLTQQTDTFNYFNRAPENHNLDQQTNQFIQRGQIQSEQLEHMHHHRGTNRFKPQPAAKPTPKPRHPKTEHLNHAQQSNLQLQTTAGQQELIPLNYAQQSNTEWESADKIQQDTKENVREKDDMNIEVIATPIEVHSEVDIDDHTQEKIFRGDQAQRKPNDDFRQQSITVNQQNEFPTESRNLQQSDILQKSDDDRQSMRPRLSSPINQLDSQWHYVHNPGDLTNSESPQVSNFHEPILQRSPYYEQQSNIRTREQYGWQKQEKEDGDDIQQETQYINFGQEPQGLQQSSKIELEKPIENPVSIEQTSFNRDKYKQHPNQDHTEQQSHLETEQLQNYYHNPFLQQSDKMKFGQQSENLRLTQQTQFDEHAYDYQQSDKQPFGRESQLETNNFYAGSNHQQIRNREFERQSEFGQTADDFQQQSGKIVFGHEDEEQTHDLQQSTDGEATKIDFQPRILQAYGASGPYEAIHNEDIFNNVKPNPSATLLPNINTADPWDIHEKSEVIPLELTTTPEPTTETPDVITEAPPSFWGKLGNKFISTFDKAKEKARSIFG